MKEGVYRVYTIKQLFTLFKPAFYFYYKFRSTVLSVSIFTARKVSTKIHQKYYKHESSYILGEICRIFRTLLTIFIVIHIWTDSLSKQCRSRWDAAESSISSGSTLFATHPAIFRNNIIVNCTCSNFRTSVVRSWGVCKLRVITV